jgi:hypothetical protein
MAHRLWHRVPAPPRAPYALGPRSLSAHLPACHPNKPLAKKFSESDKRSSPTVAIGPEVTISTDNITLTNKYRSGVGAHWPFLSDAGRIVQKDLDIAEYTDPDHNPMIPQVIVLEPGLVVYKIYHGYWFFGRPTLESTARRLRGDGLGVCQRTASC